MAILFAGAFAHEFGNAELLTTDGAAYDADYAPGYLQAATGLGRSKGIAFSVNPASGSTKFWFHTRIDNIYSASSVSQIWNMLFYGENGNVLFGLANFSSSDGPLFRIPSSVSPTAGSSSGDTSYTYASITTSHAFVLDLAFTQNGTNHILEIYIDGTLVSTLTRARTTQSKVVAAWLGNIAKDLSTGVTRYSEIICTESESTVNMRLSSVKPTGAATVNSFASGTWPDVADGDLATGALADAVSQRLVGAFDTYAGEASPSSVRAVILKARRAIGLDAIAVTPQLRISGTNYDTPDTIVTPEEGIIMGIWNNNPATAAAWATAAIDAEGGMRSHA